MKNPLFQNHLIRSTSDRSWVLCRHNGQEWDHNTWVEINSLEGGLLYVGSEQEYCLFGKFTDSLDPKEKIAWIGAQEYSFKIISYARSVMGPSTEGALIKWSYWAVHRLHYLLPTSNAALKTIQMRLEPKTIANIVDVGTLTGANSYGDALAYCAELAKLITQETKRGKTLYFEAEGKREHLDIAGS